MAGRIFWAKRNGDIHVKKVREFAVVQQDKRKEAAENSFFVFCDKRTGVAQFRAQSSDREFAVERVAGLLAMQCLVRGHDPNDFVVLVPAEKSVSEYLLSRANDLLEEGRAVASPAALSPRQKEILHSVICNRANKEIASHLNITVRTVKFHISALLNKFSVQNRTELARRAAAMLGAGATPDPLVTHGPMAEPISLASKADLRAS